MMEQSIMVRMVQSASPATKIMYAVFGFVFGSFAMLAGGSPQLAGYALTGVVGYGVGRLILRVMRRQRTS